MKSNPKLFDLGVAKLQKALAENLPWLNYSFGICEKLTDIKEGKKFHSANLYIGKQKYMQIMPCKELGNFSFFMLKDPQDFSTKDKRVARSSFSLIIWYDTRDVSLPSDERDREAIKALVLDVLSDKTISSWVTLNKVYERPENIFADLSYDYTNNQFLMSPYAGLRIDGEMLVRIPCTMEGFEGGAFDLGFDFGFDIDIKDL